jgi:hypothetical protein
MFNERHYVAVVRWKQAERLALRHLTFEDKQYITPIVELTPNILAKPGSPLLKVVDEIVNDWGHAPAFLDLHHLWGSFRSQAGFHPLTLVANYARSENLDLVYVTPLQPSPEFVEVLRAEILKDARGVCLRIPLGEARRASCARAIDEVLDELRLDASDVDLVIDGGIIGSHLSLNAVTSNLGNLTAWRSFTFLAGAFPKDLQGLDLGSNLLPRTEWQNWHVWKTVAGQSRLPTFGDFTIQWASYEEPPEGWNPSASLRYTTYESWLVMRGEALRAPDGTTRYEQYPANAELLCARPEFCGESYSDGDHYIWAVATRRKATTGSPMSWLSAGINHHMSFVIRQLQGQFSAAESPGTRRVN